MNDKLKNPEQIRNWAQTVVTDAMAMMYWIMGAKKMTVTFEIDDNGQFDTKWKYENVSNPGGG